MPMAVIDVASAVFRALPDLTGNRDFRRIERGQVLFQFEQKMTPRYTITKDTVLEI